MSEILKAIEQITTEKKAKNIKPDFAISTEIMKKVLLDPEKYRKEIRRLIKEKKIVYGKTLNNFYFRIK